MLAERAQASLVEELLAARPSQPANQPNGMAPGADKRRQPAPDDGNVQQHQLGAVLDQHELLVDAADEDMVPEHVRQRVAGRDADLKDDNRR